MSFEPVRDRKGDINQFTPQKTEPIYEYVYRKFKCQEDVVGNVKTKGLTQLSWNIHTPQDDFVWKSVRLHMPFRIKCKSGNQNISMRLSDRNPACNVAISSTPLKMFTDCQLILSGNMFSIQPNFYQSILDTCYQSRDETSYMSSMSLKPSANRNLKKASESTGIFAVLPIDETSAQQAGSIPPYVQIEDAYSVASDHAFDLTFANPGFVRRVANFQTDLQGSITYADTDVISYLDIGPFMNKVRKTVNGQSQYNTAVPFVKDFSLKLMLDQRESEFDRKKGNVYNEQWPGRVLASSLLEFGTPVNMNHYGESELSDHNWAELFDFELREKPYLEVCYVKMGSHLQDRYKLRYIDYQYEKSDPFSFVFPVTPDRLEVPSVPVRINSRLLEVASKVYVWCELAQEYKKSFFLGGTQRCCKIDKLHLRINNRNDILFEPSQEMLFDNFKRLTGNPWGISTWRKCPIYVFDPSTFGLDAYKTGQAQLMHYEWDLQVQPTELLIEEILALEDQRALKSMGYIQDLAFHVPAAYPMNYTVYLHVPYTGNFAINMRHYQNWVPNPGDTDANAALTPYASRMQFIPGATKYLNPYRGNAWFALSIERRRNGGISDSSRQLAIQYTGQAGTTTQFLGEALSKLYIRSEQRAPGHEYVNQAEIMRPRRILGHHYRFDGLVWGVVDIRQGQNMRLQDFNGIRLFYVPESFMFDFQQDDVNFQAGAGAINSRVIFNSLRHYDFAANQWTAYTPNWDSKYGFITGKVTQIDELGNVVSAQFNRTDLDLAPGGARGVCPGMRAYPYQTNAGNILGILNSGIADGGAFGAKQNRGGYRATAWGGANNYHYIRQVAGAAANQEHFKWIAFQLEPDAATGANNNDTGLFLPYNTPGDSTIVGNINTSNVPVGDIQSYERYVDGAHISDTLGQEVHFVNVALERNVFNSQTSTAFVDYGEAVAQPGSYGAASRFGRELFGATAEQTATEANTLKFETSVLYEFGQKRYVIERDGHMTKSSEDYPSIQEDRNVVAGKTTFGAKQSAPVLRRSGRFDQEDEFHQQ